MKHIIKVAIFTVGAAAGALVTYQLIKDKYSQEAQEEIDSMKAYYTKEIDNIEQDHWEEMKILVGELDDDERQKEQYIDYVKKYTSPNELVKKQGYDKIEDIPEEDEWEDGEPEDEYNDFPRDDPPESPFSGEEPYVISTQEFEEEALHFDKITITYYDLDDTLADEQEEIIADIGAVVGYEALTCFGNDPDDPDVVHVRNVRLGSDYEICRTKRSYTETVLGIADDEPRPRRGKNNG